MLELTLYAIGVMYSPGPVNLHALNMGTQSGFRRSIPFCLGVGSAMFCLFMVFGLTGEKIVGPTSMKYIVLVGSGYILYLAYRIYTASPSLENLEDIPQHNPEYFALYGEGLLMQILNPKGIIATVPIGTLYFPALDLSTGQILISSGLLAFLAMGAPGSYSALGRLVGSTIRNPQYFHIFNRSLAALLVWTALSTALPYLGIPALFGS
ncbi:MAG: LysE family translocator [Sneathiella sp.]